jgi:DNA repair photolyase
MGGLKSPLLYKRNIYMKKIDIQAKCTGTREWSDVSHNIATGCSHGCLYCYASAKAVEKGYVRNREEWLTERITPRKFPDKEGVIMFPTAHDITPYYLEASLRTLQEMLEAGREVLIVTKAHTSCIKRICDDFEAYKDNLLIRITIGSMDTNLTYFWEPHAPSPIERFIALGYAYLRGFNTSVSMEPMLHGIDDAENTFRIVEPYITEKVWIGKMNYPSNRVDTSILAQRTAVNEIIELQSDSEIMILYEKLKDEPKVEWKDSIKQIIAKNQK